MGKFVAGDVAVTGFSFSNLSAAKRRPALVLAEAEFGNIILCQITSKAYSSKTADALKFDDFAKGGLPISSYIRPDKLFTAEPILIEALAGTLKSSALSKVLTQVRKLFST
jgi:mRNA interferase MazF